MSLHGFLNMMGFSRHTANYSEKVISTVGGFLGIFGILLAAQWLLLPASDWLQAPCILLVVFIPPVVRRRWPP